MGYDFYLGGLLLPVTPEALTVRVNGRNSVMTLIDDGEVSVLREPGLSEIRFSALLPSVRYPFARYAAGFLPPETYLAFLERVMKEKSPFQFIVSRRMPGGAALFDTNLKVSLEGYTLREAAGETGFDARVDVQLKQFRPWGAKTFEVETPLPSAPVVIEQERPPASASSPSGAASSSGAAKASPGKAYKVQIPGMALLTVQASSVMDAIKKSSSGWKGTIYVNGVAYNASTGQKITVSASTTAAQTTEKAQAATGKTATKPGVTNKKDMVYLQN